MLFYLMNLSSFRITHAIAAFTLTCFGATYFFRTNNGSSLDLMNPASQGKHDTKLFLKCKGEYSSLLFSASILQKAREDVDTAGISNYAFSQ